MLFYTVGYGSEFSIKGRIIDSETGKPIEGAYIGCAGLFEVKRDTPIYVSESEIVTVNALKQEWLKKKIENRYGKIPDDVKIDYIFRRTKDAAYGSPEGTQKIDVSTWEIEDIVDYTLNTKRSYRMFETGDKVFSWLIKLSGRAKTGKNGGFEIKEMYAPEKDVVVYSHYSETVSKYYLKKLSEMREEGSAKKCIGLVLQVYAPDHGVSEYGIYNEKASRGKQVFNESGSIKKGKEYICLGDGSVGKLKPEEGYEWLTRDIPGQRYKDISKYEIFKGSFPEVGITIEIKKPKDKDEYRRQLREIAYSSRNDKILENTWSIVGGQTSISEYYEFRDAFFNEWDRTATEQTEIKRQKKEGFGRYAYGVNEQRQDAPGDIMLEEYIPEVIIEGKWGSGDGEFGTQVDENFPGTGKEYKLSSLAVDSKGNIYILDVVNNRIQKYSKQGKYLNGIPVESFVGKHWGWEVIYNDDGSHAMKLGEEIPKGDFKIFQKLINPTKVQGVNIVIDSEDNLYYYCIRKDGGKERGEVWEFKNDKVVEKQNVPASTFGMYVDTSDGDIYIGSWNIIKNQSEKYSPKEPVKKLIRKDMRGNKIEPAGIIKAGKKTRISEELMIENPKGKKIKLERKKGEWFHFRSERITSKGEIYTVVTDKDGILWHYKYNSEGKLIAKALPPQIEGKDKPGLYDNNVFRSFKESGDIVQMNIAAQGITITKWERKAVR